MPALWPSSLPQKPLRNTWTEKPGQNVVRFQPDIGPPKIRRRSTSAGVVCSGAFAITNALYATFWTFYTDTLAHGSLPFSWAHWQTGVVYNWLWEDEPDMSQMELGVWRLQVLWRRLP